MAVPLANVPWVSRAITAKLLRTPRVTPITPVLTEGLASSCLSTNTSATAAEDGQGHGVSRRTAVCPVPVLTEVRARPCQEAASDVPVLLATQVLAALMTQMNAKPHPSFVRMKACVSTPRAPTSATALLGSRVAIVRTRTSPVLPRPASTAALVIRALIPATPATACQDSTEPTVRTTSMIVLVISVQMEELAWMESTPTTASALQSGLANIVPRMWTSAVCSQTLVRMEEHVTTRWAATLASASTVGVDPTARRTLTTAVKPPAAKVPPASTESPHSSASVLTERPGCCVIWTTLA